MNQHFCDVLPQDNGWMFVMDGYQSAIYPNYELAVRAANEHAARVKQHERIVLRCQTVKGDMMRIAVTGANSRQGEKRAS
ncbi:hypothetical protein LJR030_004805 [Rhizobium sp. LjRoot30]|uniref:hypothetical protein n=1 Tax=Rhizobium sp. LjRoot30 TaxID=3342320 RepID=UPI003ECD7DE5